MLRIVNGFPCSLVKFRWNGGLYEMRTVPVAMSGDGSRVFNSVFLTSSICFRSKTERREILFGWERLSASPIQYGVSIDSKNTVYEFAI
jgi:hypothetical protein